ncbi:bifunctional copper resistance protein CopD/cytochrome c oxidase assembly protein [Amycolatopsis roodepoortensis]|uniref:bifunctional copper resistance protein CopD/cytochrome c oxidase assembly protein n=1 Tax=Amycolatopsis roodepoortensis TaxID=700274 RepID=UPI00214C69FB|nr:bifunctional copper resistance protein CopD/cytochrome c oxidase assembly protein [Amycolatopsis roodepoortensis]UUV35892.1 bifunctional copper resistance protein CopD/cytochrome c oxidase assembly protein [Amycolatopsis roodepoortensis]
MAIGAVLAVFVAVFLVALTGGAGYPIAGLSDPGVVTRYGITVVRVVAQGSAVICVGGLLLAAFLVAPQRTGILGANGYAAVSAARNAAWVWFVASVASMYFTAAEAAGWPVTEVMVPQTTVELLSAIEQPKAWLITAAVAFVVAVGCHFVLTWGWTATLFLVAVLGQVPVAVTGHSASGGSHDVATNSLLFHLVAATLWVGGLIAVVALGYREGNDLLLAVRRFSRLALVCWLTMGVSGVINALVRMSAADLLRSGYGLLVLAKVVALALLGLFGHQQRARTIRALSDRRDRMPLIRLAAVEVLIMSVTIGLAAALARTPPPATGAAEPSTMQVLIGYDLDGPPTLLRLLFAWRFDLVYGTAAIVLAGLYVAGVRRLRRRGDTWPPGRTTAWLCGCAVLLLATSSGIGRYAPAMFSVHMGTHMLLAMVTPALLVLGGPVTLALRSLPTAGGDNPPGPREWLVAFVHSPVSKTLAHPLVALVLFVGSVYVLYFSGLYGAALNYHWAHLAMNAHFLLVGYLFYWPVIGVDPAPRPIPPLARVGLVFASLPFHAFFAVALIGMKTVIGATFFRSLQLPWVSDPLADQRLGGSIAWASGELPVLIVLIACLVQWARSDQREARRRDRREEATGDADLTAYNAMLQQMANGQASPDSSAPPVRGSGST